MDTESEVEKRRKEALDEALERGTAFNELTHHRGWALVSTYIQNRIQTFATRAIKDGFKSMEEYQLERGEVNGLRKLLAEVNSSVELLKAQNNGQKDTGTTE